MPAELPNETPEYRKARAALREAEVALKDQVKAVAELRRQLPTDTLVETDYLFHEGPADLSTDGPIREVRLSELFTKSDAPLILLHFMFGKQQEQFCPMCTMWADGYDGAIPHVSQRANFAVVVAGELAAFRGYARERGWRNLRLLSSAPSTLKRDLDLETPDGGQLPGVSVFLRGVDGRTRHFYTGSAMMGGGHFNGMDLFSPVWHFLDLTPAGREDWMPSRQYPA